MNINAVLVLFLSINSIVGLVTKAEEVLRIGAIPDQHPEKLNRMYTLLSDELEKQLSVRVRYIPVSNYAGAVSAFRTRGLDLVWFGGLTGVQARLQTPESKIIAQRDIDRRFKSVFIANKKSNLSQISSYKDLTILKGKRFTFGSESSTSGRLMPQYFIEKSGLKINDFYRRSPGFSGSHDATIALVQSGTYEAGALNKQVWDANKKSKRLPTNNLDVIWVTPAYSDYHWLAQSNLDKRFGEGFTSKLQRFLLSMRKGNSDSQAKILNLFGANKFIKAKESEYIFIEQVGRKLGKIR